MKYLRLFIFLFLVAPYATQAQSVMYSKPDSLIYGNYTAQFKDQKENSISELIIKTAKFFLGKPYVASTLEVAENETLTLNLRELDCTTFIENCIALSLVIKSGDTSFDNYCTTLQYMRYRGGAINGYTSRLHYTSDWIYENEKRNILENISLETGGEVVLHPLHFMSGHPDSYKHLKDNSSNLKTMKEIEAAINERNNYSIISLASIPQNIKNIKNGDIVAFATSVSGLDYSHVGIAYWEKNQLHFIHASSRAKQVVIEKKTLLDYCKDSKNCTGISILRINNSTYDRQQ